MELASLVTHHFSYMWPLAWPSDAASPECTHIDGEEHNCAGFGPAAASASDLLSSGKCRGHQYAIHSI